MILYHCQEGTAPAKVSMSRHKPKRDDQEERIRMREIGMHLEERYAAMPTAADAPPLKSN